MPSWAEKPLTASVIYYSRVLDNDQCINGPTSNTVCSQPINFTSENAGTRPGGFNRMQPIAKPTPPSVPIPESTKAVYTLPKKPLSKGTYEKKHKILLIIDY